jgi:hypothetical protein|tara:strand:- start:266 stop:652 length:387 start_codon:yes stop_codon:yes gene_type:complete
MKKGEKRGERSLSKLFLFLPILFGLLVNLNPIQNVNFDEAYPGDFIQARINLENTLGRELKDVRLAVYGMDFSTFGITSEFDMQGKEKRTRSILLPIPNYVRPGEYTFKISFSNDNFKDSKYRYATVK